MGLLVRPFGVEMACVRFLFGGFAALTPGYFF